MIAATLPRNSKIERIDADRRPPYWRNLAPRDPLQVIGSDWALSRSSAVLAMLRAVIPAETHYLTCPQHGAFARIEIGPPQEFPPTCDCQEDEDGTRARRAMKRIEANAEPGHADTVVMPQATGTLRSLR